jgi:hypothetical protein
LGQATNSKIDMLYKSKQEIIEAAAAQDRIIANDPDPSDYAIERRQALHYALASDLDFIQSEEHLSSLYFEMIAGMEAEAE